MHNLLRTILITILLTPGIISSVAQTYTLDEARALYNEGKYEEAAPTFAKEVKRKPNNGSVNHWYGVCLFEMGQYEESLKYLKKGVSRKVKMSNLYLGRSYAALYRFADAIESYESYIKLLKKEKEEPSTEVTQLLASAKLGQRMMRGVERVQVIDSLLVDSISFVEAFKLSPEAGRWVGYDLLPEAFQLDDTTLVSYLPQRGDMMYMGYKESDNYDLYYTSTLVDNEWSNLQVLSQTLNTTDNQNYPFQLSDGQTLYFAQDGENSLGGYDIFVTMFNSERGDYMLPQNVGMPFNSPYNDFMMAIDETIGVGWFVTDRNQIQGKLTIYIFIPNSSKKVYDNTQENICNLARLTSIADTWLPDADYTTLLDAIDEVKVNNTITRPHEFTFVVCDGIVYHYSTDFKNTEALHYYNQSRSAQQKIDSKQAELETLRAKYHKANVAEKAKLKQQILAAEEVLLQENNMPLNYANRARRAELSFLGITIE